MYGERFEQFIEAYHFDSVMREHFEIIDEGDKRPFSADVQIIARMMLCSGSFRSALLSNDLIYYRGLLYSSDAFSFNGERIILSEEAKTNPEKYCLLRQRVKYKGSEAYLNPEPIFDILHENRWGFSSYWRSGGLNPNFIYAPAPGFNCEPDHKPPKTISWESSIFSVASEKAKENRFDRETFSCYMDEVRDLPDDFGGLLQTFISASKKSQEEVAFEADMSVRNLSRLIKNKQQPKLETVVALCISLHLFPLFSEYLISSAGYSLRNSAEGIAYKLLINQFYMENLHFCNDLLRRIGLDPLTDDPFGELGGRDAIGE